MLIIMLNIMLSYINKNKKCIKYLKSITPTKKIPII